MRFLRLDQWLALTLQLLGFVAFVVCGDRADAALGGRVDDMAGLDRVMSSLPTYRQWDEYAAIAGVATVALWIYGVGRAVHRGSWKQLALFAAFVPVLFAGFVIVKRMV